VTDSDKPVGIIAGRGPLPLLGTRRLNDEQSVYVCHLEGDPPEELDEEAEDVTVFDPGDLGAVPDYFNDRGVDDLYLLGDVDKKSLYEESNLSSADSTVTRLLDSIPNKGDEYLIKAATQYLASRGLMVRGIDDLFGDHLMPEGHVAGPELSDSARDTIDTMKPIARRNADDEVGQSIMAKRQSVVAVEAVEGTSRLIERAGQLAGGGCVMIKSARTNQDARYDMPVVGRETVESLAGVDAAALAVEAGRILWLQQADSRRIAEDAELSIVGYHHENTGLLGRFTSWWNG
jgi:DUF1009 family protein